MRAPSPRRRRRWTALATSLAAVLVVSTLVGDTSGDVPAAPDSLEASEVPEPAAPSGPAPEVADARDGSAAAPGVEDADDDADGDADVLQPPSEPVLTERMPAADALDQLDADQVARSAAQVNRSPADYRDLVTRDDSYWMDRYGATYVVDPAPSPRAAAKNIRAVERHAGPVSTPAPSEAEVLSLHSNPDSSLKIFIDVTGGAVPADWRDVVDQSTYPAWDPAGDGSRLSASERVALEAIWSAVAADYEPFDVDVTTEDPGRDGLLRSLSSDSSYGVTIALTDPANVACGDCAGIAYLDTFSTVNLFEWWPGAAVTGSRLGWTFSAALGHDIDAVAQTISHEAGHTLGLEHDGQLAEAYYFGHGHWNSIMGGSNAIRIHTQWSRGDYVGATNREDDVAILASKLRLRDTVDTSTRATAASLTDGRGTGLITSAQDVDMHRLGSCGAGELTLRAAPTRTRSNLDIELTLLDKSGPVALDRSGTTTVNPENAVDKSAHPIWLMSGLAAEIDTSVPAGAYWVQVRGGKNLTWRDNGYDNYGSTGAYELIATCADAPAAVSTTSLTVTGTYARRTLTATVTREDGEPADGQVLFIQDGDDLGRAEVVDGKATRVVNGIRRGIHQFTAEFVPADADDVAASVSAPVRVAVGVTDLDIETMVDGRNLRVTVTVVPPDGATFQPRGVLTIEVAGARSAGPPAAAKTVTELRNLRPGIHELTATYATDDGQEVSVQETVTIPPSATETTLTVTGSGASRTLTADVVTDEDLTVTGAITFTDNGVPTSPTSVEGGRAKIVLSDLVDGDHVFGAQFTPADPTLLDPSVSSTQTIDVVAPATVVVEPTLSGNTLTLAIAVGPRADGVIDISARGKLVTSYRVTSRHTIATIKPMQGGRQPMVVTYRPAKGGPVSHRFAVSVPKLKPAMKVKAPKKVRKGKKAKFVATVRSNGQPVTGKVRFTTKGWKKTVWLNAKGKAKIKGPRLVKGKKQKFVVRYLGDDYTKKSKRKVVVKIRR